MVFAFWMSSPLSTMFVHMRILISPCANFSMVSSSCFEYCYTIKKKRLSGIRKRPNMKLVGWVWLKYTTREAENKYTFPCAIAISTFGNACSRKSITSSSPDMQEYRKPHIIKLRYTSFRCIMGEKEHGIN